MTRFRPSPLALLPGCAVALALILGPPARGADDPNEVVGRAGSAEVKLGQIRESLQRMDPAARQQAQKDPQVLIPAIREDLGRQAVLNEARDKKWEQRPEVQTLLEQARNTVIVNSYLQSAVQLPAGFPSEPEILNAYEANKGNLLRPAQFHLAQIFMTVPASADKGVTDAVLRHAEELSRKARAKGADFGALARESSDDKQSAANGGDMGWVSAAVLLPEIRNIVTGMTRGEVSPPVHLPAGYAIVKLIEAKPSEVAPLPEVREGLIQTLRQRKFEELRASYVNGMLDRAGLAINEMALRKAVTP
jgi:parvulin-like peptidyl-prolyl isomerase